MDLRTPTHQRSLSVRAARAGGRVNYIRNAVKVTIDAYHGTTVFHLLDPTDPIASTIGRVFPGLFRPLTDMPADLRRAPALSAGDLRHAGGACSRRST